MATLRDIKRKIGAVRKTQQITRAMNMVAAAKLRGAQSRMENFRPYAAKYAEVLASLAARVEPEIHPFLQQPDGVDQVELVAFAADRGLCGSFNANMIAAVEGFLAERQERDVEVSLTLVGRKLREYFRRRPVKIRKAYHDTMSSFDFVSAGELAREVMDTFLEGQADEIWVYYTRFVNMVRQEPTLVKLLPIPPAEEEAAEAGGPGEYLCEPSAEAIMIELLPKSFVIQIYNAMLETSTSEHAARMAAMDNASKNCKEMIENLTLVYNKARQQAITLELMDIVGGAEALRSA